MHDGRLAPKNLGFQLPDLKLEHINIPRLVTLWFCHMLLHISTIDRFRLWIYINMESVARSTYSSHSTSTAITDSYWSRLLIMFQSVIHVFARLNQVTNILKYKNCWRKLPGHIFGQWPCQFGSFLWARFTLDFMFIRITRLRSVWCRWH